MKKINNYAELRAFIFFFDEQEEGETWHMLVINSGAIIIR